MKKFIVITCLAVAPMFALTACSSPEKKMEKIRQSLKSHYYDTGAMKAPMGGTLTVNDQYPKITFNIQIDEALQEGEIPKDSLKEFNKQIADEICRQIPKDLDRVASKAVGESNTKLLAQVLQTDGVNFEFVFKDKIGRDIAVVNQKLSSCPNFGTLLN